ncbi:alcohol dehydrogenase catalytic domain-containing protein, partial [Salmonella enterica]
MKASVYYSKNDIRYEDVEEPEIGDGDMLIKMHSCGLCGTDIHKAQHQTVTGPIILGHEVSGEVVKVGKDVTRYRVGERVVTAIHVPCFNCHYCDRGFFT